MKSLGRIFVPRSGATEPLPFDEADEFGARWEATRDPTLLSRLERAGWRYEPWPEALEARGGEEAAPEAPPWER